MSAAPFGLDERLWEILVCPGPEHGALTADLDAQSTVHLSDFHAKKAAIVAGIGFGWLPDWLSVDERARGELVALNVDGVALHTFSPTLVLRAPVGPAAEALRAHLTQKKRPRAARP